MCTSSYDKLDKELYDILKTLVKEDRLVFWSKFLQSSHCACNMDDSEMTNDKTRLLLLNSWRDILVILAQVF